MYRHQWQFTGRVLKIVDGRKIQIGVDLGFSTWKKVVVQFNRIREKGFIPRPELDQLPEPTALSRYLDQNLKNKNIVFRTFRKKNRYQAEYFYAEIYTEPGIIGPPQQGVPTLREINNALKNPFRIEGMVNVNDLLVEMGLAEYVQLGRPENAPNPVYNRPARGPREVPEDTGDSTAELDPDYPPRGGYPV